MSLNADRRNDGIQNLDYSNLASLKLPTNTTQGGLTLTPANLPVYNITVYGAVGDWNGTTGTDNTTAMQAAINAANAAGGGIVFVPTGAYKISSALTLYSDIIIMGAGASALNLFTSGSTIVQSTLNADIFTTGTLAGGGGAVYACAIRDINLTYSGGLGSPTGGAAIRLAYCQVAWIERVYISTCYDGIVFGADTASPPSNPVVALWIWVRDCVVAGVVNSAFVVSGNTANLDIQSNLCFGYGGNSGNSQVMTLTPLAYCDVMYFRFNDCESFGNGMLLQATSSTVLSGVGPGMSDSYIEGNIFDACGAGPCLLFSSSNRGAFGRFKCTGNWCTESGSTQSAVVIQAVGTGVVKDITLRGNFFSSSGSYGLAITGSGPPSDIEISDNQFYGCNAIGGGGLTIATGTRVHVRDNMMSTYAGAPNNYGGIAIASGVTAYIIEGNDVRNAASYGISNSAPTQGLARNNPGYNPIGIGASAPAFPASTATQGNPYPTDAMVYITANAATTGFSVVVNGYGGGSSAIPIAASATVGVRIPWGGSITPTYGGTAPTWVWAVD